MIGMRERERERDDKRKVCWTFVRKTQEMEVPEEFELKRGNVILDRKANVVDRCRQVWTTADTCEQV